MKIGTQVPQGMPRRFPELVKKSTKKTGAKKSSAFYRKRLILPILAHFGSEG